MSENVLFQWADSPDGLKEKKKQSKFVRMIKETNYGRYAVKGDYVDDNPAFILERDKDAKHYFKIKWDDAIYGIWHSQLFVYVSDKYDPSCLIIYALNNKDHSENTLLTKDKKQIMLQYLAKSYKLGRLRFESMEIKKRVEPAILTLL
jgi:hypothetical protein